MRLVEMPNTRNGNKVVRICRSCGKGLSKFEPECSFIERNEGVLDSWF